MSRRAVAAALAIALVLAACGTEPSGPTAAPTPGPTVEPTPEPRAEDMVAVCGLLPGLYADLRYATAENFTGEAIYDDAEHAEILEAAMERAGFEGCWNEWWHYTDSESCELCESLTELPTATAECEEYLTLRAAPDPNAEAMGTVPAGAVVTVLDDLGSCALVRFGESRGYVMGAYLRYEGRP